MPGEVSQQHDAPSGRSRKRPAFPAVTRRREYKSVLLSDEMNSLFSSLPKNRQEKLRKQQDGEKVRQAFAQAIVEVFGNQKALQILEHVQGVYIEPDKSPRKASSTGRAQVFLNVYSNDAVVKTDLDFKQERLKTHMRKHNVHFDTLKPYSSTGNMRYREPFAENVRLLQEAIEAQAARDAAVAEACHEGVPDGADAASRIHAAGIDEALSRVDDPQLAEAMRRAVTAWFSA